MSDENKKALQKRLIGKLLIASQEIQANRRFGKANRIFQEIANDTKKGNVNPSAQMVTLPADYIPENLKESKHSDSYKHSIKVQASVLYGTCGIPLSKLRAQGNGTDK